MYDTGWDAGLDEQQLAAVMHGDDPLVILAGAGTGKTRTLTSRVASLLESGTPPERVLLLTFTRRAAEDMLARVAAICGDSTAASRIWGGTFHAIAHRLIAEHCSALGLATVSVIDPGDVADLMDLMRDEHGLTATGSSDRMPRASTLADLYSRAVNTGRAGPRGASQTDYPWCEPHTDAIMGLLRAFVARKRDRGLLDFDDLLLTWRALLDNPATGDRLRERWDHVLVDEFQDVNQIQVDIVHRLRVDGQGLTVVGDDAQAVYGFRGAASGHLLDLARSVPKARTVKLESNFRSRQPLLDLANIVRPGEGEERLVLRAARADEPRPPPARPAGKPRLVRCYDAPEEARQVADALVDVGRARRPAARPRRADAGLAPQRPARARADRPAHPVREVRRAEVPGGRARQGLPGHPAGPGQPAATRSPGSGCCGCIAASARPAPAPCCSWCSPTTTTSTRSSPPPRARPGPRSPPRCNS